ncbi:MAG TPA: glycosyltransferase family 1 protein [Caldimonas sp.]|nr:glycosyltransferase family 1 protein [Caldimonas sp.]
MRIVVVTDAWTPQVNGVVTTLVDLRSRLLRLGHDVTVIEPSLFARLRCPGYPEIELALGAGRRLARLIDDARPDAIHIATEGPLGWTARGHCRRRGLAFTTAFHSRFPEFLSAGFGIPARWGYAVLRRFHAASAGVMVPSLGTVRILQAHRFANLRPWSHGIDLALFRPTGRPVFDWPRPAFLYVGRVSPEKNLDAFLRLDLPGVKIVCGGGPSLARYRQAYPEVRWVGPVRRDLLVNYYAAADVFVYPSRTDTFGLVMLEALACGTPVAAFPVAGPLDVVGNSDGGVLDADLCRAALGALQVPRERARARAQTFDWDRVAREFIAHLAPIRGRSIAAADVVAPGLV